jgi:predicted aldo/keto reductase-like oxidoreductase
VRYRRLGRTGLSVSELGLGGGGLRVSSTEYAVRLVHRALELGVTYFDTAPGYGDSEIKLGIALEGRRQGVVLATKTPAFTADEFWRTLDASLSRLRTDHVDVLQVHDTSSPEIFERRVAGGVFDALAQAKSQGLTRFIGVTGHRHAVLVEALNRYDLDTVLTIMNVIEREATRELIPLTQQRNLGMVVMKPLAFGRIDPRLALRFLLTQPISCAIPGASRFDWLEENVATVDLPPLSPSELDEIERLRAGLEHERCRICALCEPCPKGVPIGMALGTYRFYTDVKNMGHERAWAFPWGEWAREHLPGELARVTSTIESCDYCGECEAKCPHGLPVSKLLKDLLPGLRESGSLAATW